MAEPLIIFGRVASAVQLTDVALRVVRRLYNFFCDVKDAPKEAERLKSCPHAITTSDRSLTFQYSVISIQLSLCSSIFRWPLIYFPSGSRVASLNCMMILRTLRRRVTYPRTPNSPKGTRGPFVITKLQAR